MNQRKNMKVRMRKNIHALGQTSEEGKKCGRHKINNKNNHEWENTTNGNRIKHDTCNNEVKTEGRNNQWLSRVQNGRKERTGE